MADHLIHINRQSGVVIGYEVSEYQHVYLRSETFGWFPSGSGTGHTYPDWKSASAALLKAIKRGSCSAAVHAIVIPERLWP